MAVVVPTTTDISGNGDVMLFTWTLTTADHTGLPIPFTKWGDRSMIATGDWGSGSTALGIEGSNDDDKTTYVGLSDSGGTKIALLANGSKIVLELSQWARPRLTVVGVAATVKVTLLCRRQPMGR